MFTLIEGNERNHILYKHLTQKTQNRYQKCINIVATGHFNLPNPPNQTLMRQLSS